VRLSQKKERRKEVRKKERKKERKKRKQASPKWSFLAYLSLSWAQWTEHVTQRGAGGSGSRVAGRPWWSYWQQQ
jgi:hypothetical protein